MLNPSSSLLDATQPARYKRKWDRRLRPPGSSVLCDPLADITWLFRGVPRESPEVKEVRAIGEVRPPRPDRIGEYYRSVHSAGDTETGYTSWSTDRSMAETAGEASSYDYNLSGRIVIFRVRLASISRDRIFLGLEDEDEVLIEGPVEDVSISASPADEEEP